MAQLDLKVRKEFRVYPELTVQLVLQGQQVHKAQLELKVLKELKDQQGL
jgi:hypothetical protein